MDENTADLERRYNDELERQRQDEESASKPGECWFVKTAFPLTAVRTHGFAILKQLLMLTEGMIGPLASAMNICALAQVWRVYNPSAKAAENRMDIPDPWWLPTVNAISLACALIANIALLLRMTRRLSFMIANTLTIFGWSTSCVLLIVLVAVVPTRLSPPQPHALSQAFYYAIIAAVLYFIVSALMLSTVYATQASHQGREFKLTMKQRTLMVQTISFLGHLLLGAAVYSCIEGWRFLDAVYCADFTLLTVGIGNYSPSTHLGRSLLIPYATSGTICLGLLVNSIRAVGLERGENRIAARMLDRERQKMVKRLNASIGPMGLNSVPGNHGDGRSRKEFGLMRKVQKLASRKRRWTFLFVALITWLTLWLAGAVVFWRTEQNQHWSYFESLYFGYVSLMTIGYGSLYPTSNSGLPFYVVWSLLAVPTVTILVNNLESTIAAFIRDTTLLIGELTILPGDVSAKDRLKSLCKRRFKRKTHANEDDAEDMRPLGARSADSSDTGSEEPGQYSRLGQNPTDLSRDRGRRAFLLAREIRKVIDDTHESLPKRYTYDEWVWFLKLLGDGEQSSAADSHGNVPSKGTQDIRDDNSDHGNRRWSWLGKRSVLMVDEPEPEWVLKRLCTALERSLKTDDDQQQPGAYSLA